MRNLLPVLAATLVLTVGCTPVSNNGSDGTADRPPLFHIVGADGKASVPLSPPLLDRPVPELKLHDIGFEDALRTLGCVAGVGFLPNWTAMEALGVQPETSVSLELGDVTLGVALRELLTQVAGREDVLDFIVDDARIRVSTCEDLNSIKYIKLYDVHDLLAAMPDVGTKALTDILCWAVLPDSWAPSGDVYLGVLGDGLVIRQSDAGHREVLAFLMQLSRALGPAGRSRQRAGPSPMRVHVFGPGDSPASDQTAARLDRVVPEFKLEEAAFADALAEIARQADVNIVCNWNAMKVLGITPRTMVSINLKQVTLRTVLGDALTHAAGRPDVLDYRAGPGVVRVSTIDDLSLSLGVLVCNVGPLVAAVPGLSMEDFVEVVEVVLGLDLLLECFPGPPRVRVLGPLLMVRESSPATRRDLQWLFNLLANWRRTKPPPTSDRRTSDTCPSRPAA